MDKLVSIKGLVIRATPVIPDMKEGKWCLYENDSTLTNMRFPFYSILPLQYL